VRLARKGDIQTRLRSAGAEPVGNTSEEFAAFLARDHQKWSRVIKAANITPE